MIDKVIIAEDHESANLSVQKTMEELSVSKVDHVYYCDDALKKIKIAAAQNQSYDLLITDLSFDADNTSQTIAAGIDLITAARSIQPELRVLVFSAESRIPVINMLFKDYHIDGFVRKARHDAQQLKKAIYEIDAGRIYYPAQFMQQVKNANTYEFSNFDVTVIRFLSEGFSIKEMPDLLKEKNIKPSSLSSVEKRLNQIREELNFTKNEQVVLFCKEIGIL